MDRSAFEEKSSFKMLELTSFSKLDWGSYASKKIRALICSMKCLSPEVDLYLYKSTILLCMNYCCPILANGPICCLELLDKLQKQICMIVIPSLSASLETLAHPQNVGSFSLFFRYYFGRCYLKRYV